MTQLQGAYVFYLIWLTAGFTDFRLHRASDLAHTSGLRESRLHGVQLAVIGIGVLLWCAFTLTGVVMLILLAIAVLHACLGYADTRSAYGVRPIVPAEQHVHSILDLAPWIFLAWSAWHASSLWSIEWAPRPPSVWVALLLPPIPLVILPWLIEYAAAGRVARMTPVRP